MDNYNQQLESIYAPQEAFIQKQIAELPSQYEPQKAAIEQAKVNAFRDIQKESFKRGRFFGGFQPAEQARYLGERYLPGLQQLTLSQQQAQQGLLGKMVELQAARATSRLNYAEQLRQEQIARQREEEQFQRQLALQRTQSSYSRGGGGEELPSKKQYLVQAFANYDPGKMPFYTERQVIPALEAAYNISNEEAKKLAYSYRKQYYGK